MAEEVKWHWKDEGSPEYLDGIKSQFTVKKENGAPIAYAFVESEARLIAAAPELLEACLALIEAVDNAPPVDLMKHIVLASDLCRSAAAKATGSPQ